MKWDNHSNFDTKINLNIEWAFSTFKVRNMYSVKDYVPHGLRLRFVNQLTCADGHVC